MPCAKKRIRPSIFGKDIDRRCPSYSLFGKFLVLIGILADEEQSREYSRIDRDIDRREGCK